MRRRIGLTFAWAALVALGLTVPARAGVLINLDDLQPYELRAVGFELPRPAEVEVEAIGLSSRYRSGWFWERWNADDDEQLGVYAWLLDTETRLPVWVMERDETERVSGSNRLRSARAELELDPGRYELYVYSGFGRIARGLEEDSEHQDESWWNRMFSGERRDLNELEDDLVACSVTLMSDDVSAGELTRFDVSGDLPGALIRLNRVGDSQFLASGFRLDRPADVRIYGHIERRRHADFAADYGWLIDADSREIVWDANAARSRQAGGGSKNRVVDEQIQLDAGRYILFYGSDDTHSYEEFNVGPPHDPLNWGVSLLPGESFDASAFSTFDPGDQAQPLMEFSRAGDNAFFEQPFRLGQDAELQILALGEATDEFYDYAWITDAAGAAVWEMTDRNTRGAGGDGKNRMFDGMVELPRGDYVLYYASDASHSFEQFNASRPFLPEAWGVIVRPGRGLDPRAFELIDEADLQTAGDFLARLVRVGHNEERRAGFELDQPTQLKIHALGEGQSGDMFDYGYILDERTGRKVWEMTYDVTNYAGGANKNREVVTEIELGPGSYEAVYVSDGSHSFEEWNARRPRAPLHWGITVQRLDD